jgi:hypothetical protein
MAYDEVLADRIRERLGKHTGVGEKRMFGGLVFFTEGNMTVGVFHDDLIARIGPGAAGAALARPGVRVFDITGRPMRNWVVVDGDRLDDADLDAWIDQAAGFVATLPPK